MSERVRLTPGGGNEWVECVVAVDYYLELYDMDPRHSTGEFMLTDDEVLALALLHPAVKELLRVGRFILLDDTVNQDGYAALGRGMDEELVTALKPFEVEE